MSGMETDWRCLCERVFGSQRLVSLPNEQVVVGEGILAEISKYDVLAGVV